MKKVQQYTTSLQLSGVGEGGQQSNLVCSALVTQHTSNTSIKAPMVGYCTMEIGGGAVGMEPMVEMDLVDPPWILFLAE